MTLLLSHPLKHAVYMLRSNHSPFFVSLLPNGPEGVVPLCSRWRWAFLGHDFFQTGRQVHFRRSDGPRFAPGVENLVTKVDGQENGDADVCSEERADRPVFGPENTETVNERQDGEGNHRDPRTPRLKPGVVIGQFTVRDTLGLESFAETEIYDGATDPGLKSRGVCKVDELGN